MKVLRRASVGFVAAATSLLAAIMVPAAPAAASSPTFPLPIVCSPSPWRLASVHRQFEPVQLWTLEGGPVGSSETVTQTATRTTTATVTGAVSIELSAAVATAKAEVSASASVSMAISTSHSKTWNLPPHTTITVGYGFWTAYLGYTRTFSPAGCNEPSLPFEWLGSTRATARVPYGQGFHHMSLPAPQGRPTPGDGSSVDPPRPPQPEPVTSVYGLADGTVLATTDTRRIYKMVGGAPVWQATCADNICEPQSRPTTQAVIDAGPDVPRNGSSAVDQRGRVYLFVGGAPLWQHSCAAPVSCGTPVRISDWSIDARDHMNVEPADRQLIQGASGGTVTPVAQTVGGARINFASAQEVVDTGYGTNWQSQVVVIHLTSFNELSEVPRNGTLIQGAGSTTTPVAMMTGGARINFASAQEVIETGYGEDWRSKVRTIPTRAFNEILPDVPPDHTLVQGIANGVATPVAQMIGGVRINFANPDEVVAAGYGTDWRRKVHVIPTRAFNLISDGPPADGTLLQGAGGTPTPVAVMVGGRRVNFASEQEIVAAGHGADWRRKVHAIPPRVFHQIAEGVGDGVRVKKMSASSQGGVIGGALVPFASQDELEASGFGDKKLWIIPDRAWDALPRQIVDGTRVKPASTSSQGGVIGGALVPFASQDELEASKFDTRHLWVIPDRLWDALPRQIGDGTRVKQAGTSSQGGIVGGALIPFASQEELEAAGYGTKLTWILPDRVWDALPRQIADGTRLQKAGTDNEGAVVGGALVPFISAEERDAAGYGTRPLQVIPGRVWDALPRQIADGTHLKKAGTDNEGAVVGGALIPFSSPEERNACGYENTPRQVIPGRVWDALPRQIADGTRIKSPDSATVWLIVAGTRVVTTSAAQWTVPQRIIDAIPQG